MKTIAKVEAYEEALSVSFKGDEWLERSCGAGPHALSEMLAQKTAEFLANGGVIEVLEEGISAIPTDTSVDSGKHRLRVGNKMLYAGLRRGDL